MKKEDSMLYWLDRWRIYEQFPALQSHLVMEDIEIPDMKRTMKFLEILKDEKIRTQTMNFEQRKIERQKFLESFPDISEPRTLLPSPTKYLRSKVKNSMEAFKLIFIPEILRENYNGLTPYEMSIAYLQFSLDAEVLDDKDPVSKFVQEICQKRNIVKPKLVIADSDMPFAHALMIPRETPCIIISKWMREALSPEQFKAIVLHELDHVSKRGDQSFEMAGIKAIIARLTGNNNTIKEEFAADEFARKESGEPQYLVEALVKMQERLFAIKDFAEKSKNLFMQNHVSLSALPPSFDKFLNTANVTFRIMPDEDRIKRARMRYSGSQHPPLVERFDVLYKNEHQGRD